jgi:ubiquinone biosynthesis monooxygenase Coq7
MTTTDALINALDASLRTLFARTQSNRQPARLANDLEAANDGLQPLLSAEESRLSGALMRVNHVGEVCAQGLYASQALGARLFSKNEALAQHFEAAGAEEGDHLAWTEARLKALNDRPSLLNPVWYAGAFALGLTAARLGERISLGFVVETERQVEAHLASHMGRLPEADLASRRVVAQMQADEARHAQEARLAGAAELPPPIQAAMRSAAKVMTTVAHHV